MMNINLVPAIGACDADNNRASGLEFPHCDTMGSVSLHGFQAQSIDSASVILQEAQGLRV
jgi:hypothetical protein